MFLSEEIREFEFESDLGVNDLIDHAIDNIKDELGYLGKLKNIKVTIKKGKSVDDECRGIIQANNGVKRCSKRAPGAVFTEHGHSGRRCGG